MAAILESEAAMKRHRLRKQLSARNLGTMVCGFRGVVEDEETKICSWIDVGVYIRRYMGSYLKSSLEPRTTMTLVRDSTTKDYMGFGNGYSCT